MMLGILRRLMEKHAIILGLINYKLFCIYPSSMWECHYEFQIHDYDA
jgi:hypothetical protein